MSILPEDIITHIFNYAFYPHQMPLCKTYRYNKVLKNIKHYTPKCYIWNIGLKYNPIQNGYLDIMYGTMLTNRFHIKLLITEVEASFSPIFHKWEYMYGAGWQYNQHKPFFLESSCVWQ